MAKRNSSPIYPVALLAVLTLAVDLGYPARAHASFIDGLQDMLDQILTLLDPPLPPSHIESVRMGELDADYDALGLTRDTIALWEDGMRMDPTAEGYGFEWWYFDGTFDDGSSFVVSFYSRIDMDPTRPFVRLNITTPEGEILASEVWGDRANSSFSTEECNFNIGADHEVTSENGTTYHIRTDANDLGVDLVLERTVASFRQETGHMFIGDAEEKYLAWFSMVPRGNLSGTITYNGETHEVTGQGYHDHNWGTAQIQEELKHWWWMRGYVGDTAIIAYDFAYKNKYGGTHIPIYGIVDPDGVVAMYDSSMDTRINGGNWGFPDDPDYSTNPLDVVPFRVDINTGSWWDCVQGTSCIRNRFNAQELMESTDLISLNNVDESAREFLALLSYDPWYLRYNGTVTLDIKGFNGQDLSGEGTAIIEYLDLE